MNIFTINDHSIEFKSIRKKKFSLNITTSQTPNKPQEKYGFVQEYDKLSDKLFNSNYKWPKTYAIFANPYSLINLNIKKINFIHKMTNIKIDIDKNDKLDPIGRAYFKMWEIMKEFPIIDPKNTKLISSNIAEGPGGFIQAIVDYRKKYAIKHYLSNKYYAITLINTHNTLQFNTNKNNSTVKKFMNTYSKKHKMIEISYGDNDIKNGDLNKVKNIIAYTKLFDKNKADIITGDGGLSASAISNNLWKNKYEEYILNHELRTQLFFNQLLIILSVQKKNKNFVCKFFARYDHVTAQMIYMMGMFYKKLIITKPVTSSIDSGEFYLVGIGFKGIDKSTLDNLYKISTKWYELYYNEKTGRLKTPSYFITNLFDFELPRTFVKKYSDYNKLVINNKINTAQKVEKIIKGEYNKDQLQKIITQNLDIAKKWYNKNDLPYNLKMDKNISIML